jgi:hypothetical protein
MACTMRLIESRQAAVSSPTARFLLRRVVTSRGRPANRAPTFSKRPQNRLTFQAPGFHDSSVNRK